MRIIIFIVLLLKPSISQQQKISYQRNDFGNGITPLSGYNFFGSKLTDFQPDSSINRGFFLQNFRSLFGFSPIMKKIPLNEKIRESAVTIFSNNHKEEYLLAYHYEGDLENDFSRFEIGYFEDDIKIRKNSSIKTKQTAFKTESDLGLRCTLEDIIKVKGNNYRIKMEGSETVLVYHIDNHHAFVKRYRMPGYFMEFRLRDNKARRITFGFDYP